MKIKTFSCLETWTDGIIEFVSDCSEKSIRRNKSFHIVLSGGDTPRLIYPELAKIETNWKKWHFWIGDERFPSEKFTQLNKVMIQDLFLDKITYLPNNVHFMKVELGFDKAISDYTQELKKVDIFDFVLLGIGEDGHTASLFPGNNIGLINDSEHVLNITNSPKAPSNRLSLSANRLNASRNILFIVKGVNKKNIIEKIGFDDSLPCNKIIGKNVPYLYYYNDIK